MSSSWMWIERVQDNPPYRGLEAKNTHKMKAVIDAVLSGTIEGLVSYQQEKAQPFPGNEGE